MKKGVVLWVGFLTGGLFMMIIAFIAFDLSQYRSTSYLNEHDNQNNRLTFYDEPSDCLPGSEYAIIRVTEHGNVLVTSLDGELSREEAFLIFENVELLEIVNNSTIVIPPTQCVRVIGNYPSPSENGSVTLPVVTVFENF